MKENGLNVLITGPDAAQRELATAIVRDAFLVAGFSDTQTVNAAGETAVAPETETMLDLVKQMHPNLLTRPVRIQGSFASLEEERKIDGAFGPEPIGYFGYVDNQWESVQDVVSPNDPNPRNAIMLYSAEKDRALRDAIVSGTGGLNHTEEMNKILHGLRKSISDEAVQKKADEELSANAIKNLFVKALNSMSIQEVGHF